MYSEHAADAEAAIVPGGITDGSCREQEALPGAGTAATGEAAPPGATAQKVVDAAAPTGVGAALDAVGTPVAKMDSCFLRHCRTWVEGQSRAIAAAMRAVDEEMSRCSRTTS